MAFAAAARQQCGDGSAVAAWRCGGAVVKNLIILQLTVKFEKSSKRRKRGKVFPEKKFVFEKSQK